MSTDPREPLLIETDPVELQKVAAILRRGRARRLAAEAEQAKTDPEGKAS